MIVFGQNGGKEGEPILYTNKNNYMKYFPNKKGVNKSKLQMTNIGLYSVTPYWEAKLTVDLFKRHLGDISQLTITETNGGMGGNTLAFADSFMKVNTIEKNKLHCSVLKNNLDVYKKRNVNIICDDYSNIYQTLNQDVIFMDPPWGGRDYKLVSKLKLYIGNYTVEDILNKLIIKMAIVKAPRNFDIDTFKNTVIAKEIIVIIVRNYINIVVIK